MAFEATTLTYDEVVWYRKRWLVALSLFIFTPATIVICLSGDVFAEREGAVFKYSKSQKYALIAVAILFIFQGILRFMR